MDDSQTSSVMCFCQTRGVTSHLHNGTNELNGHTGTICTWLYTKLLVPACTKVNDSTKISISVAVSAQYDKL